MSTRRLSGSALSLENFVLDGTVDSATTEDSRYPRSKLLDALRSRRWRSTAVTLTQIAGTFSEEHKPTLFALIDSNMTTALVDGDIEAAQALASVWLEADTLALSAGDAVSPWNNAGTLGGAFTQATVARRPTFETNEIDSKPIVRFDSTNDGMDYGAPIHLGTNHLIIAVVRFSGVSGTMHVLFGLQADGNESALLYIPGTGLRYYAVVGNNATVAWSPSTSTVYVIGVLRVGTSVKFYVNGVQQGATQTLSSDVNFSVRYLGNDSGMGASGLEGDLAELLIVNSTSDIHRRALEDYLASKWNVTAITSRALRLELADDSGFTTNVYRWALYTYPEGEPRTRTWYLASPDNAGAVTAATWDNADFAAALASSFWRLTIPASATTDSYYEIGNIWLGEYTDVEVADASLDVVDPSNRSYSASQTPFVDVLSRSEAIEIDVELLSFAAVYFLKEALRRLGPSHAILDLHAGFADATVRAAGAWYGMLSGRRGAALALKSPTDNSISLSFQESGG